MIRTTIRISMRLPIRRNEAALWSIQFTRVERASADVGEVFEPRFQQAGLDLISQKTGGETYYLGFGSPVDFTPYLDDVSFCLKHQYELVFLAKGAKKPTLEPVKVKTEMPKIGLVTATDGYVGTGI